MKFRWKSPTQITKVADTNHLNMSRSLQESRWQVHDKPVCVAVMEFSPLQCTGKVGNKVRDKFSTKSRTCRGHKSWKSATWFVSQTFRICVRNKFATLLGTCPGLYRKVGVMEFGLYSAVCNSLSVVWNLLTYFSLSTSFFSLGQRWKTGASKPRWEWRTLCHRKSWRKQIYGVWNIFGSLRSWNCSPTFKIKTVRLAVH